MRAFVALTPPAAALAELEAAVAPLRAAHPDLRWTPATQWHLTLAFLGEVDERVLPELTERLARAARRHGPLRLALGGGGRFGDRVLWTRVRPAPPADDPAVPSPRVARSTPASSASDPGELRVPPGELRVPPGELCVPPGEVRVPPGGSGDPARRVARSGTASDGAAHAGTANADALRRLAASVGAAARRSGIAIDDRPYRPHLTLARSRGDVDLHRAADALARFVGSAWTAQAVHLFRSRLGAGPGGTAAHEVVGTWPLGG